MGESKGTTSKPCPSEANSASWDDLAAFLAVARAGGLAGAARGLGVSGPTLGRRMRALEQALGRDLFRRRTHGYDLTEDGQRLLDDLAGIEAGILRVTRPSPGEALPLVRITAGTYTMMALAPLAGALTGDPPDLRLRLLAGEAVLSIARREADIGFRARRPIEAGLAGRKLRDVAFAPYAAPDAPDRWIVVAADTPSARWVAERASRDAAIQTDTPRVALDLALAGLGRLMLPDFLGDARAELERVGNAVPELTHEQWIVTHADRRAQPEVRRTLDRIEEMFA
ncbi:LysR family transcriptional regulator [Jannaschia sp. LMIT008]|uniref:LysR family transcriptional regulator n=1 Tax=Jannaschia maritima TaxID=3032585 RepID=UPI0028110C1A|nr:LysR family transcriptional regulator [Jannaschia sp. LMIT008]